MAPETSTVSKELALFRETKAGSPAAFKVLFLRYYDKLHAFVMTLSPDPFLAEETVQEVFVRLWERRATISIHSSVRYYLYRSCRNTLYNLLEKKAAHRTVPLSSVEEPAAAGNAMDLLTYKLLDAEFRNAVKELPEKAQKVFLLRYYHKSKHKEIARHLRISESMVEKHWANALRHLRKKLAAHFFQ